MNAVDTNVLIYTHDPRDPAKQNKAVALVASLADGVLLWQVACEYIAASRKLTAYGLSLALGSDGPGGSVDDERQRIALGCFNPRGVRRGRRYAPLFGRLRQLSRRADRRASHQPVHLNEHG